MIPTLPPHGARRFPTRLNIEERFHLHIHTVIPFSLQYQHHLGLSDGLGCVLAILAFGMAFWVLVFYDVFQSCPND